MNLVKIDLRTLKKNPNAGNTVSYVYGSFDASISFVVNKGWATFQESMEEMSYPTKIMQTANKDGIHLQVECKVKDKYKSDIVDRLLELGVKQKDIEYTIKNDTQTIFHAPEREYFFEYLDTKVKCEECGEKFKHTELDFDEMWDEEGESYCDTVCPKCRAWYCCDLRYEKVEEALAREEKEC
jgi:hypothetical protein